MGTRKTNVVLWLSVGIMVLAICFSGCYCDKPTEPKPPPDEGKDYAVYVHDAASLRRGFAYHPSTNEIDSFVMPYDKSPIVPSSDGKLGYIYTDPRPGLAVVDLDSLENEDTLVVLEELPYLAVLAVSPDGQLLAVAHNDSFQVVRVDDGSVVFADTGLFGSQVFNKNSDRLYVGCDFEARVVDLSTSPPAVSRKGFDGAGVYRIVPSPDEGKWYLYMRIGADIHFLFAVYDVASDSIIFSHYLTPGHGKILVTPDGRHVFYSNRGTMTSWPGPPWIYVYDVATNSSADSISTVGLFDPPYEYGVPIADMCLTPDGRWLTAIGFDHIFAVDVSRMEIADYVFIDASQWLQIVTCQSGL